MPPFDPTITICGPWERTSIEYRVVEVPKIVRGLSSTPVRCAPLHLEVQHERRKVWVFAGYEERTTEA